MGVTLQKGGNASLPDLTKVIVGLGWGAGPGFDLDASALACGENKKVLSDKHFVYWGNKVSPDGSIKAGEDKLEGSDGDDDDETIEVDLPQVQPEVASIVFPVEIYEANKKNQNFGQVSNAYIRVVDASNDKELARYDLFEDASTETAMVFGELYRRDSEWKFRAIGQGYASGLAGIARDYGVNVEG